MANNNYNKDEIIGWDDEIVADEPTYQLLPPDDYNFTVVDMKRESFNGSDKLSPCPLLVLTLRIKTSEGNVDIRHSIFMLKTMEWQLGTFLAAIGQKRKGEKIAPKWQQIVGSKGKCKIINDTYTDKSGNQKTNNKVAKFYDYVPEESKYKAGVF